MSSFLFQRFFFLEKGKLFYAKSPGDVSSYLNVVCLVEKQQIIFGFVLDRGFKSGADPGFQVRGGRVHLKKLQRAEGGAIIFGVFRVKNHDFTPKKSYFSQF